MIEPRNNHEEEYVDAPGLFHSKERFKQLKTLSSPALSLRHILKALLTI
jgi:hypothetical protein